MNSPNNPKAEFIFLHEFAAPKELVFNAFSNAEALNEWWGPVETANSVISLDFRPGGIFHFKMEANGKTSYGRFLFSKINPPHLLEFTNAFADEEARVVNAPFDMPFPREIFYSLAFTENKGKTTITLTSTPVTDNAREIESFISINNGMEQGFGDTFNKLAQYLYKLQNV